MQIVIVGNSLIGSSDCLKVEDSEKNWLSILAKIGIDNDKRIRKIITLNANRILFCLSWFIVKSNYVTGTNEAIRYTADKVTGTNGDIRYTAHKVL